MDGVAGDDGSAPRVGGDLSMPNIDRVDRYVTTMLGQLYHGSGARSPVTVTSSATSAAYKCLPNVRPMA